MNSTFKGHLVWFTFFLSGWQNFINHLKTLALLQLHFLVTYLKLCIFIYMYNF